MLPRAFLRKRGDDRCLKAKENVIFSQESAGYLLKNDKFC